MLQDNSQTPTSRKIRIITNVLTAALKLWLRSQVSQVKQLEVEIKASDRQLLSGCIPWVSIFATHAVYQGLHLTQIQLVAENIRVNIGSVLKGQPLRLLETVPVVGELIQEEDELNASLSSSLLPTALNDVLVQLLPECSSNSKSITWQKINLDTNQAVLCATLADESSLTHLNISMGLELLSAHELQLKQIQVARRTGTWLEGHNELYFNLGTDVEIQDLTLLPGQLVCRGRINVNP
jgi:LmeA-like phospholipid-binding